VIPPVGRPSTTVVGAPSFKWFVRPAGRGLRDREQPEARRRVEVRLDIGRLEVQALFEVGSSVREIV
jgi:hypothetical protein